MNLIVKITTLPNPLDLLAPHVCRGCGRLGEPLCTCCKNYILKQKYNLCPNCKSKTINGFCQKCKSLPPIYAIGERNKLLDQIIHDYKYHTIRSLAKPLAEILNQTLPTISQDVIIVPLPTSTSHIRERSLDHTLLIAKHLAKLRHYQVKKLLLRSSNTTQVGSDRKTRLKQAESAYQINNHITIEPDKTYLLFDDVWTTGASMKSAIKKLQQAGVSNIIVALLAVSRLN